MSTNGGKYIALDVPMEICKCRRLHTEPRYCCKGKAAREKPHSLTMSHLFQPLSKRFEDIHEVTARAAPQDRRENRLQLLRCKHQGLWSTSSRENQGLVDFPSIIIKIDPSQSSS